MWNCHDAWHCAVLDCKDCDELLSYSYAKPAEADHAPRRALDAQVGGDHYKRMAIQPVEYMHRNGIAFVEGTIIKYVSRWRAKGGIEDLRKARHMLDLLIEMELGSGQTQNA